MKMLFHEIYGSYFRTVAAILAEAVDGPVTERRMYEIAGKLGFGESAMTIPTALKMEEWPLLDTLNHAPCMPLTTLEKRWMKAILLDKRARLFDLPQTGLEDVEPLFLPEVFDCYDQYADGDPYDDPAYIRHFRVLLRALREKRRISVCFCNQWGVLLKWECVPLRMEYSPKDDKFRLMIAGTPYDRTVNVARITQAELLEPYATGEWHEPCTDLHRLVLELRDERNTLERAMMHFSHLKKETKKLEDGRYRVTLCYDQTDETEILIRVLAFGPMLRVVSPDDFVQKLRTRLEKQLAYQ